MGRPTKTQYAFGGLAGCVQIYKPRRTGLPVGVYNAVQADLCDEAGAWVTVCETHGSCVNHSTLTLARYHSVDPTMWCHECATLFPDKKE